MRGGGEDVGDRGQQPGGLTSLDERHGHGNPANEGVGQVAVHDTGLDAARLGVGDGADRRGLPPAFRRVAARESHRHRAHQAAVRGRPFADASRVVRIPALPIASERRGGGPADVLGASLVPGQEAVRNPFEAESRRVGLGDSDRQVGVVSRSSGSPPEDTTPADLGVQRPCRLRRRELEGRSQCIAHRHPQEPALEAVQHGVGAGDASGAHRCFARRDRRL